MMESYTSEEKQLVYSTAPGEGEAITLFLELLHITLDPYFIMLSFKQGGIKYHFLSLWYDLI